MGLGNIATGWARHMKLISTTEEVQKLSNERVAICGECPDAKESRVLEFFNDSAEHIDIIYCTVCSCPCTQKSLVENEKCPKGKW